MLKKVLKYDLKFVLDALLPLLLMEFILALLTRGLSALAADSAIIKFFVSTFQLTLIILAVTVLITSFTRNWIRLARNLYGDEAYLTHTLPVEKSIIYQAKFLNALLSVLIAVLADAACLLIVYYSPDSAKLLITSLNLTADVYQINLFGLCAAMITLIALEMLCLLLSGYTGIIVGHRSLEQRSLKSTLYSFGFYLGSQSAILLIILVIALFDHPLLMLFTSSQITDLAVLKTVIAIAGGGYLLICFLYYCIDQRLLAKGLNVD